MHSPFYMYIFPHLIGFFQSLQMAFQIQIFRLIRWLDILFIKRKMWRVSKYCVNTKRAVNWSSRLHDWMRTNRKCVDTITFRWCERRSRLKHGTCNSITTSHFGLSMKKSKPKVRNKIQKGKSSKTDSFTQPKKLATDTRKNAIEKKLPNNVSA